jgi:hypothetical protein
VIVVVTFIGPSAGGLFSALRTFLSLPERFTGVISGLYATEIAERDTDDAHGFKRLLQVATEVVFLTFLLSFAFYAVSGQKLFEIWTRGRFSWDWVLFCLLFGSSALRAWWGGAYALLLGARRLAGWTLTFLTISMLILLGLFHFAAEGTVAVAAVLLLGDIAIAIATGTFAWLYWDSVMGAIIDGLRLESSLRELGKRIRAFRY